MPNGESHTSLFSLIAETIVGLTATGVIWIALAVRDMREQVKELLDMHEHPEETGFGTRKTEESLTDLNATMRDLHRSIRELVHYQRWMAENLGNGRKPPPPITSSEEYHD